MSVKKMTPSITGDVKSVKSGEIFRTICGRFSFVCTYCDTNCKNGDEIMNHINSHFDEKYSFAQQENIKMSDPPLASPEFVSINQIKQEPDMDTTIPLTSNNVNVAKNEPTTITNDSFEWPKTDVHTANDPNKTRIVRIVKRKRCTEPSLPSTTLKQHNTEDCQIANTAGNLISPPTTRIVKIVKRKSVTEHSIAGTFCEERSTLDITHFNETQKIVKIVKLKRIKPCPRPIAKEKQLLSFVERAKEPSSTEKNARLTETSLEPVVEQSHPEPVDEHSHPQPVVKQSHPESVVKQSRPQPSESVHNENVLQTPNKNCVRLTKQTCYQCDMVPRVRSPTEHRRHICLFCPTWFPNHFEFELHVREIHKQNPGYVACEDFYCYVCEKRFDFRQYLTEHMASHMEDRPFLCTFCGSSHKTIGRLVEHEKSHDKRRLFECVQCGRACRRYSDLLLHASCHSTDLSFVCKVCSKAFKAKRYLNRHMAVHADPKIPCRHCDALFHFVSVRRAHEQKRHNVM